MELSREHNSSYQDEFDQVWRKVNDCIFAFNNGLISHENVLPKVGDRYIEFLSFVEKYEQFLASTRTEESFKLIEMLRSKVAEREQTYIKVRDNLTRVEPVSNLLSADVAPESADVGRASKSTAKSNKTKSSKNSGTSKDRVAKFPLVQKCSIPTLYASIRELFTPLKRANYWRG